MQVLDAGAALVSQVISGVKSVGPEFRLEDFRVSDRGGAATGLHDRRARAGFQCA